MTPLRELQPRIASFLDILPALSLAAARSHRKGRGFSRGLGKRGLILLVEACSLVITVPLPAQAADSFTVRGLDDSQIADFHARTKGCAATLLRQADRERIGVIANASWVLLGTGESVVEAPVLSRDGHKGAPEVRFSTSLAEPGTRLNGVLGQRGASRACPTAPGCMESDADLSIVIVNQDTPQVLFSQRVYVVDPCAGNARVFKTTSWGELLLRALSGH